MSTTRNNHYVPQWYQKGFFEPGRNTYSYLDLAPPPRKLPSGRVIIGRSKFDSPTSRAFSRKDLYSTFFGTSVSDGIERKLFGDIDTRGADAIRAFSGNDVSAWHQHFQALFEFLDMQKIRTPKGLDWLRAQYPRLTQNELMFEMAGIRLLHCTIWSEGVREIVSAEDAAVKFIVSDHPVTVYNYAVPPNDARARYPHDPSIALKGSQTIFPLNREHCLILTNLEYAQDPASNPLEKRTFAGNYRRSMARTDAFIRVRKLTSEEVIQINRVLKARANRYIAAGKEEWLYPEISSAEFWADLRNVLLPPTNELWRFGGELYARFEGGEVYYQDAFGRTEKERPFLKKEPPQKPLRDRDLCGCGFGRTFSVCCKKKPAALRPTWGELSIRERNLILFTGIADILNLRNNRDWTSVRRNVTDEKIREVYGLYDALWPLETNLLTLLPKPDGAARAIYTGVLHPAMIGNCALGLSLYFDELLIQHPFVHPRTVKKEVSPIEHPEAYRQEFLNSIVVIIAMMPLIELGLVTLFPDPCHFDFHLRDQMLQMAKLRAHGIRSDPAAEARLLDFMREEHKRTLLLMPREALRRRIQKLSPELDETAVEAALRDFDRYRELDPLSVLQEGSLDGGPDGGQFIHLKMVPNFEVAMYLSQATGSCIVTDSASRWRELVAASRRSMPDKLPLSQLQASMEEADFVIFHDPQEIVALASQGVFAGFPELMRRVSKYLSAFPSGGAKPNVEAGLNAKFKRTHGSTRTSAKKSGAHFSEARVSCLWPAGGIQDNNVNRLLLMSSSEHHLDSAPMALFVNNGSERLALTH